MVKTTNDENEWASALCTQFDPEMWFAAEESNVHDNDVIAVIAGALRLCNDCPLQNACAVEGMNYEMIRYGIWGGLLAGERMDLAGMNVYKAERRALDKAKNLRRKSGVPRKTPTKEILDAARRANNVHTRFQNTQSTTH